MTEENKLLPQIPSKLIHIVLRDIEKAEKHDGYTVDMWVWHEPDTQDKTGRKVCSVCAAGAVARFGLGVVGDNEEWAPDLDYPNEKAYRAINQLRIGYIVHALDRLNRFDESLPHDVIIDIRRLHKKWSYKVTPYEKNPLQWKADMKEMAKDLEEIGL